VSGLPPPSPPPRPGAVTLFVCFLRLGAVSFGGPAMVAYIHRLAVTGKAWLSEEEFQQGVALCQAVPGATAMQCAAYVGLRARGLRGAVCAYLGFGLPAFVLMLSFSVAYQHALKVPLVTSMLTGMRALVVALVANATWSFGRSSLKRPGEIAIALATAVLFSFGGSPFPIVAAAGLSGALMLRGPGHAPQAKEPSRTLGWRTTLPPATILAFGAAIVATLVLLSPHLARLGLVMMKVDVFAFGGGFASVPLMLREVVDVHRWLPSKVFMDGIALGQVTPGPIVITSTFVGYQISGFLGAVTATVCIFLPSLFTLVLVEPWFERLRSSARFRGATRGFVVSFVGLLASVTLQFSRLMSWDLPSTLIAAGALATLLLKVDVLWVVLVGAVVSAVIL